MTFSFSYFIHKQFLNCSENIYSSMTNSLSIFISVKESIYWKVSVHTSYQTHSFCIFTLKSFSPVLCRWTLNTPDVDRVSCPHYNNKISWCCCPWCMLPPLYHPYERWHMKGKSFNPGQMNTNLLCWHDTASYICFYPTAPADLLSG